MQQGVTLVELLITLAIAVIMLTLGATGMTSLVQRNTRATAVNAMVGHLNFARVQAVVRATDVAVCPVDTSDLAAGCTGGTEGWVDGYAVIEVGSGDVLRVQTCSESITMESTLSTFRFQDDGTLPSAAGGHITVCDARDDAEDNASRSADLMTPVEIIVSGIGRIRLSDTDGTGNDPDCS